MLCTRAGYGRSIYICCCFVFFPSSYTSSALFCLVIFSSSHRSLARSTHVKCTHSSKSKGANKHTTLRTHYKTVEQKSEKKYRIRQRAKETGIEREENLKENIIFIIPVLHSSKTKRFTNFGFIYIIAAHSSSYSFILFLLFFFLSNFFFFIFSSPSFVSLSVFRIFVFVFFFIRKSPIRGGH